MTPLERNTIRRLAQWFPTRKPKPFRDSVGRLWKETDGGLLQLIQDGCDDCGCETGTGTGTGTIIRSSCFGLVDCPQYFLVTLSGVVNGDGNVCASCSSINGTYLLGPGPVVIGSNCVWEACNATTDACNNYNFFPCNYTLAPAHVGINLTAIRFLSPGFGASRLRVSMDLSVSHATPCAGITCINHFLWQQNYASPGILCADFTGEALPSIDVSGASNGCKTGAGTGTATLLEVPAP